MAITARALPPNACTWCSHERHDDECPRTDCPCAYRKPTDPERKS
jgi:hypothetical protein